MSDALIGYEEYVKRLGVYQDRQVPFVVFWVKWFLESGLPDDESFSSLLVLRESRIGRSGRRLMRSSCFAHSPAQLLGFLLIPVNLWMSWSASCAFGITLQAR